METIQFTYGNFRYLVFEMEGRYYLLDRSPRYFIGYLFSPIIGFFIKKFIQLVKKGIPRFSKKMIELEIWLYQLLLVLDLGCLSIIGSVLKRLIFQATLKQLFLLK